MSNTPSTDQSLLFSDTTIGEAVALVQGGLTPLLEIVSRDVKEQETCLEVGMLVRVKRASIDRDGVVELTLDLHEYDDHNRALLTADYLDDQKRPCLTAYEAGFYPKQGECETLFVNAHDLFAKWFRIAADTKSTLLSAYQADGAVLPYLSWLEAQYLAHEARIASLESASAHPHLSSLLEAAEAILAANGIASLDPVGIDRLRAACAKSRAFLVNGDQA